MKVNRDPLLQAFLCRCPAGARARGWPDWRADKVGGLMAVAILLLLQVGSAAIISATSCAAAIWPVKPGSMRRSMLAPRFLRAYKGNHGAGISSTAVSGFIVGP
jgi:hypothetical protein